MACADADRQGNGGLVRVPEDEESSRAAGCGKAEAKDGGKKTARDGSWSGNGSGRCGIGDLRMPLTAASILAVVTADTSGLSNGLNQANNIVNQAASKVNTASQAAGTSAGAKTSSAYSGALRQGLGRLAGQISPALGSIVTAATPVALAIGGITLAIKGAQAAWEAANLGAKAQDIGNAFKSLQGGEAASREMLNAMKSASAGTMADTDLMLKANQAYLLGVKANADQMGQLMAISRERAKAMGESTQYMFESIVLGIGRMSPKILDNLGIIVDQTAANEAYAAKLGKTAESLTEVEQRAAMLNAVLEQNPTGLTDSAMTASEKVEAMHASFKNLKTSIGESIVEMLNLADAVRAVTDNLNEKIQLHLDADQLRDDYSKAYEDAIRNIRPKALGINAAGETQFDVGAAAIKQAQLAQALDSVIERVEKGNLSVETARTIMNAYLDVQTEEISKSYDLGGAILTVTNGIIELSAAIKGIPPIQLGGIDWENVNAMGGYPTSGISPWAMGPNGLPITSTKPSKWPTTSGGSKKSSGGGSGLDEAEQAAKKAASDLRSLIDTLLQPTDVTALDMAATKAGTYADKWDEYARKMRAIASDQNSVWRQMVPADVLAQGEEAIRGWAEAEEQAFYSGQRMSQIGEVNKEDLIKRARETIAAQQAKEAMIAQVGQWLAEAGISTVSAANLLGLNTPSATAGEEMAKSFSEGMVATDVGVSVTKAFGESIAAQADNWRGYGRVAIEYFIAGGETAITPETGKNMAERLWPYFKDIISREEAAP